MALQHLRSSTADKRPTPAAMSDGQLALNTNLVSPGLFFKDSNGDSVKIGPVHVGTTAPNVTPGAGGQAGNSKGEQWLDTSSSRYVFKIWDGTAWRSEDGEFVNVSGDTMTGALVVPLASAATPSLTFTGDLNTGIFSPGADQVAVATTGTQRLTVDTAATTSTLPVVHPLGAVGTPSITFTGDLNTGFYSPAADTLAAVTAGSNRLHITSGGLVGIGTASPLNLLSVGGNPPTSGGLGVVNPDITLALSDNLTSSLYVRHATGGAVIGTDGGGNIRFATNGNATSDERLRLDDSGRLLVGTSSARSNLFNTTIAPAIQLEGAGLIPPQRFLSVINNFATAGDGGGVMVLGRSKGGTVGSNTVVAADDQLGRFDFQGNDGTDFVTGATIEGYVDGTPGANDMPGRLVFSTTTDGLSSPTERMRIRSDGNIGIGAVGAVNIRLLVLGSDTTDANIAFYVQSTTTALFYCRNDGAINTGLATLSPYNLTTAAAANCVINADGFLYRSTSSARFKTDIQTLEDSYADALLDVRPVWYRSIAPGDTAHPDWGYWGFIAEEVAEIDPRLVFWKTHETQKDEDNNDIQVELEEPLAEGVQYDRFVPHLLNLIKRQQQAIETLEVKVAALESA